MKCFLIPCLLSALITACSTPETSSKSLDKLLLDNKEFYGRVLPKMADEDTRIDSVEVAASELRFNCTLVTVSKAELDVQLLEGIMREQLMREAKSLENLDLLLKQGATLVYTYADRDGVLVTEIRIRNR